MELAPAPTALTHADQQGPFTIVQLASGDLWAGAEAQLFNLACALKDDPQIRLFVVLLNEGLLARRLRMQGVHVQVFDESRLPAVVILFRLVAFLRQCRPNLVHTHRTKENIIGSAAARIVGARSLRTAHGSEEFALPWWHLRRSVQKALDRQCALRLQDRIVGVSQALGTRLACRFPKDKIAVVENGIDLERLRHEAEQAILLPGTPGRTAIAFVGRLVPVKRVDLFLSVAASLHARRPDTFNFYIFGDGPLYAQVRARIARLGLESHIFLMGLQPCIAPYLKRMHLLLITSDHEGLPMNLLEALALEVPVVAHAVGGIPRALGDGDAGVLIQGQDVETFVESVLAYLDDHADRRERARKGIALCRTRYSAQANADAYKQQYIALASGITADGQGHRPKDAANATARFSVCPADLQRDAHKIVQVWAANFEAAKPRWLQWMYRENVAGTASCFLLTPASGPPRGVMGLVPRTVKIGDTMVSCGQATDLAIDSPYRTGRPALQLARAIAECAIRRGFGFVYTFPLPTTENIMCRVGFVPFGHYERWTKPLRAEPWLRRFVTFAHVRRMLAFPIDTVLRLRARERMDLTGWKWHIGTEFDGRFDAFWKTARAQFSLIGDRSAAFLTWRFCQAPHGDSYRVFHLARRRALLGYVVFRNDAGHIKVADFLFRDARCVAPLFRTFSAAMRSQGAAAITVSFCGPAGIAEGLREAGFYLRSNDVRIGRLCPPGQEATAEMLANKEGRFFTQADKDT